MRTSLTSEVQAYATNSVRGKYCFVTVEVLNI